jgi:hypothetical protein
MTGQSPSLPEPNGDFRRRGAPLQAGGLEPGKHPRLRSPMTGRQEFASRQQLGERMPRRSFGVHHNGATLRVT